MVCFLTEDRWKKKSVPEKKKQLGSSITDFCFCIFPTQTRKIEEYSSIVEEVSLAQAKEAKQIVSCVMSNLKL